MSPHTIGHRYPLLSFHRLDLGSGEDGATPEMGPQWGATIFFFGKVSPMLPSMYIVLTCLQEFIRVMSIIKSLIATTL